jgi:hypothetical protein
MRALLGAAADAAADDAHEVLAAVAERELRNLLARGDHSRAIAQDLLAIDALVTYACEAAAESWEKRGPADADTLADWCEGFAAQLARVGATSIPAEAVGSGDVRGDVAGRGGASESVATLDVASRGLGTSSQPTDAVRA